jgi:mono/diheme cytochrome c family protein
MREPLGSTRRLAAGMLLLATAAAAAPLDSAEHGRVTYLRYCASCHGVHGDGRGPVSRALTFRPTDLRELYRRYGEPLDRERLEAVVDGRNEVAAHGERDMPVWGERFDLPPDDVSREQTITERIAELRAYLETIQQRD